MKPSSSDAQPSTALPLRLLHGIVFGGFTAITLVAGWPECQHLLRSQLQPFHAGPPPRPELVLAVVVALLAMVVVIVQALRGRSARLYWSGLILVALVSTVWLTRDGPPAGRTADSANLKILLVAKTLNENIVNELQEKGALPESEETWRTRLAEVSKAEPTSVRTRSFEPLPLRIQKVGSPEALPKDAPPGTLLLYIAQGGGAYELHPVGISPQGDSWKLKSPKGEEVVFSGAFTPAVGGVQ